MGFLFQAGTRSHGISACVALSNLMIETPSTRSDARQGGIDSGHPGPRPSGALRASKIAPGDFVEPTCRNYPTIRFRVGAVMTTSVLLHKLILPARQHEPMSPCDATLGSTKYAFVKSPLQRIKVYSSASAMGTPPDEGGSGHTESKQQKPCVNYQSYRCLGVVGSRSASRYRRRSC